jgi:hypothetical protein
MSKAIEWVGHCRGVTSHADPLACGKLRWGLYSTFPVQPYWESKVTTFTATEVEVRTCHLFHYLGWFWDVKWKWK